MKKNTEAQPKSEKVGCIHTVPDHCIATLSTEARKAINRASEMDRQWFCEHPEQKAYCRPAVLGEFGDGFMDVFSGFPGTVEVYARVVQVESGFRLRRPEVVLIPDKPADSQPLPESIS